MKEIPASKGKYGYCRESTKMGSTLLAKPQNIKYMRFMK